MSTEPRVKYSDEDNKKLVEYISNHPKSKSTGIQEMATTLNTSRSNISARFYSLLAKANGKPYGQNKKDKKHTKKKDQQIVLANKNNIQITKHRRPGAPVSLALEMAELAVNRLSYDEKLLLAKTILDSEQ